MLGNRVPGKPRTGAGGRGQIGRRRGRDIIQDGESSASTLGWDCLIALCQGSDHVWPLLSQAYTGTHGECTERSRGRIRGRLDSVIKPRGHDALDRGISHEDIEKRQRDLFLEGADSRGKVQRTDPSCHH